MHTPGGQATPPRQQGKKAPGRQLPPGQAISVDVDEHDVPPPQLEVQPITMYNTEPALELRRFVAASASYICYGLKAGQLRVLHRATAARALLRGHTASVTDLRCATVLDLYTIWHLEDPPLLSSCVVSQISATVSHDLVTLRAAFSRGPRRCWQAPPRTGSSSCGASVRAMTAR